MYSSAQFRVQERKFKKFLDPKVRLCKVIVLSCSEKLPCLLNFLTLPFKSKLSFLGPLFCKMQCLKSFKLKPKTLCSVILNKNVTKYAKLKIGKVK